MPNAPQPSALWSPQIVSPLPVSDQQAATMEVAKQLYQISNTLAEILRELQKR